MASHLARQRAIDAASTLGSVRLDAETVRGEAVGILTRAFPVAAWAWALSDPVSQLAASAVPNHPLEPRMFQLLASEEDPSQLNRRSTLIAERRLAASLTVTTAGHPARSGRWRTFLSPEGIGDELRIVFADRTGCWGYVDLYSDAQHSFQDDDVAAARAVARLLTAAIRRESTVGTTPEAGPALPAAPAILTLDPSMHVLARSASAADWLATLPMRGMMPLPCAVVAASARAAVPGATTSATVRQRTATGRWASVHAARLDTGDIAVTIGPATVDQVLDYRARAGGLTAREREVLGLLQRGYDTRSVARALVISEATAHDHIKHILRKTNAAGRRALLAGR